MFDLSHLDKGFRNNLLTKDLEIEVSKPKKECDRKFASWDHIQAAFEIDAHPVEVKGPRKLPKLTESHIYEQKLKKMSVKHANQVISNSVGNYLVEHAANPGNVFIVTKKKV